MFEEASKEYTRERAKRLGISDCTLAYYAIQVAHQKGAEFGYNKANEWHNPREKLPIKDCEVLIEYGENKAHRVVDWNNKSQYFGGFSIDEVTCWKEVVPSKEVV